MILTIPYAPIAKHRPRTDFKRKVVYSDQKKAENAVKWMLKSLYKGELLTGAVELKMWFYMPIPKSWPTKKHIESIGRGHVSVPDKDNLVKFIQDCMNGIVYVDDKQVWHDESWKVYSDTPRIVIEIMGV